MDLFRHVNNTIYFRYMEQARLEWLHAQGPQYADIDAEEGPVIANASCEFLAPLVYPGDIEVRMFLGKPGRTSIASFYEIWMRRAQIRRRRLAPGLDQSPHAQIDAAAPEHCCVAAHPRRLKR